MLRPDYDRNAGDDENFVSNVCSANVEHKEAKTRQLEVEDEGEEKEEEEKSRVKGYRFYERRWHPTFIIGAIETVKSEWMRDIKNR